MRVGGGEQGCGGTDREGKGSGKRVQVERGRGGSSRKGVRKVHKQRWLGFETGREVAGKDGVRGKGEKFYRVGKRGSG